MPIQYKHFLNSSASLVLDSLYGLCAANPALILDPQNKIVYLDSHDRSKVALLCGGGSGHEPAHTGFVGRGMLTAAVCGNVFASPSASQVRRAIEVADNDKGTIIIVKNYTGDVLNFGLAKERYAALYPHKADRVRFLIVGDDVAVGKTQGSIVGRRGLAGTVFVYKIAGALAEQAASLDQVYAAAEWVASNIATIGVGLDHCHVPGTAASNADSSFGVDELEIGMGIHNEPGTRRLSPIPSLSVVVQQLIDLLTSTSDPERSFLSFSGTPGQDHVVLLVNNLGGLSELELLAIARESHADLARRGIVVQRVLYGNFMTSLNMPGFSLTLLFLPGIIPGIVRPSVLSQEALLALIDAPVDVPGWKWNTRAPPAPEPPLAPPPASAAGVAQPVTQARFRVTDPKAFEKKVERACRALVEAEPEITYMDTVAGDGDCGLTLKAGAEGVLRKLAESGIVDSERDVSRVCIEVAQVTEETMGGTSGALYSIFFSALSQGIQQADPGILTLRDWVVALAYALDKLYAYTRARPPSRTLVDPLSAFIGALEEGEDATVLKSAIEKAREAAERTRDVDAKVGRSAYVEGERLKKERVPDPGAWGVKVILEALLC